jgi:hypothetical protein
MNNLELVHLKRYCDKYGLDYQEIDNSLTYYENRKHLRSLVQMLTRTLDVFEIERMAELQKQYMKEHFISYYLACQMAGETKSTEVGQLPKSPEFSLKAFIEQR